MTEWAVRHVLASAGIEVDEATDREIALARAALERCYYIDLAASELIAMLGGRAYWTNPAPAEQ